MPPEAPVTSTTFPVRDRIDLLSFLLLNAEWIFPLLPTYYLFTVEMSRLFPENEYNGQKRDKGIHMNKREKREII
jgi:hypothetical protein